MKLDASVTAVVTGGASGLGAATARALAARGVKVALFDVNAASGEALARELGGTFCAVDVTSDAQVDAGFARARAAHGQERVLVNCAGTGNAYKTASRDKKTGAIQHFPIDQFERIIQINTIGTPLLGALPDDVKASLAASIPFPKRLGSPAEYASLALEMVANGYFNGESVRLDGAIRMAPR